MKEIPTPAGNNNLKLTRGLYYDLACKTAEVVGWIFPSHPRVGEEQGK